MNIKKGKSKHQYFKQLLLLGGWVAVARIILIQQYQKKYTAESFVDEVMTYIPPLITRSGALWALMIPLMISILGLHIPHVKTVATVGAGLIISYYLYNNTPNKSYIIML
ncbi:hypothetical protein K1T71_011068 [Dendrolimus kikuchii]|uniref:Uncharacterized protein n=1 Tax=Dendrolimus kikuchii TaxID=765133 RepID=A0ACC1CMT0_9NEOP|nr:hypothetical protein K1T71_011068 [Dendrolimus kikuchii]